MRIGFTEIFYPEDIPNSILLANEFVELPSFKDIFTLSAIQVMNLLSDYDIVILCLHGENLHLFESKFESFEFRNFWKKRKFQVALWTQDDHVTEKSHILEKVDVFFFSHYTSIPKYERTPNANFLPVGYSRTSRNRLIYLMETKRISDKPEKFEFGSIYRSYNYKSSLRDQKYYEIAKYFSKIGASFEFAHTKNSFDDESYLHALLRSSVTVNVPLKRDFNLRNLEALALDRSLLTFYLPEFDALNLPKQNIVFLEYNLRNIGAAIDEMRGKTKDSTSWRGIANLHCHVHRQFEALDYFMPGIKANFLEAQNSINDVISVDFYEQSNLQLSSYTLRDLKYNVRLERRHRFVEFIFRLLDRFKSIIGMKTVLLVFNSQYSLTASERGYISYAKAYYWQIHQSMVLVLPRMFKTFYRALRPISLLPRLTVCEISEVSPLQNPDPESTLVKALNYRIIYTKKYCYTFDCSNSAIDTFHSYRKAFTRSYVFGTGPSLDQVYDHDFSDGFRVVCNTIVRNKSTFDYLNPHLICAADSIYHFGTNPHAYRFRKDLMQRLHQNPTLLFAYPSVFDKFVKNVFSNFEEQLLPLQVGSSSSLDNLSLFGLLPNVGNILNLMLLPIGLYTSKDISLLGFDGRKVNDKYFWRNSANNSYPTELEYLVNLYPNFYDVNVPKGDPFKYVRNAHGEFLKFELLRLMKLGYRFRLLANSESPGLSWLNQP